MKTVEDFVDIVVQLLDDNFTQIAITLEALNTWAGGEVTANFIGMANEDLNHWSAEEGSALVSAAILYGEKPYVLVTGNHELLLSSLALGDPDITIHEDEDSTYLVTSNLEAWVTNQPATDHVFGYKKIMFGIFPDEDDDNGFEDDEEENIDNLEDQVEVKNNVVPLAIAALHRRAA